MAFASLPDRLAKSAAAYPDAVAIVHGDRRVAYRDLASGATGLAHFLLRRGLEPGDRVAILLENGPEYAIAYYGALAAGAVAVGLGVQSKARDLGRQLEHSEAGFLIAERSHPELSLIAGPFRKERRLIEVGPVSDREPWDEALRTEATGRLPAVSAETPAALLYTSGTTGRPKAVTLSHGNFSANVDSILAYLDLRAEDSILCVLPFFYSYGSSVLHTHLAIGARLVLENSLVYPHRILERIAAEKITGFAGVPSTFAILLHRTDLRRYDLSSLRYVTQAGGAMAPAQIARFREILPHVRFFVMYGQTEATARLTYLPPERLSEKLGSAGLAIPGVEIRVCDEAGRPLPPRQKGEVCARGGNVMLGYFRDPEETQSAIRDGWLHTGDEGYLDEEGYVYLVGRRSDMIKSGAHRISPLDVEEVLLALEGVAEAAVVGVPDELLGQVIHAVLVTKPGVALDAKAVQHHCRQNLPLFKVPRSVAFVPALPKTSSGKVMRHLLAPNGAS